jgi:hypothetical protein
MSNNDSNKHRNTMLDAQQDGKIDDDKNQQRKEFTIKH